MEYLDEPGPHGFFSRLARVGLLLEAFQARCFDPFGLRFIDYSVLRMLELEGDLSPSRLADLVVRSSGGMTQILDRLERAGLVARRPDPSDRRKVMVGLTPQGLRLVRRANRAWVAQKQELLAGVGDAEFTRVDRAVEELLQRLDEHLDREPAAARRAVPTGVAAT
ncbi:MAG TPA: MarR family transcriptional regulator [Acidimicrobiales bacterium]|nr:MarR family transcriptional regulator [Acidimicrobiales bacterium]